METTGSDIQVADLAAVRRAKEGEADAFSELVLRYQDRVYNACLRICRNRDDAMDLTQTAFMKALEALPRFDERARFYTWLFRIAVNTTLSHCRSQRYRRTASLSPTTDGERTIEPMAGAKESNVAKRVERQELRQRVECALGRLDDEFRVAVVLRDIEEMDYMTIGEILGVPVGTVKSRIYRGRMMLRDLLSVERIDLGTA